MEVVSRTVVAGIDGAAGGWAVCVLEGFRRDEDWFDPRAGRLVFTPDVHAALEACSAAELVLIDVPIGLPQAGRRHADAQARSALGPRRSSVFNAPVRAVLGALTYQEACAISRRLTGKAITIQAWNIVPGIRDWDRVVSGHTALLMRLQEAHPELAFASRAASMAARGSVVATAVSVPVPAPAGPPLRALRDPKHRHSGMAARVALLPEVLQALTLSPECPASLPLADRLDAAILALAAGSRLAEFGDPAGRDGMDLPMLIRYPLPV